MLQVHSLETFSTHDGPGLRSVIFTQGCNFRCLYCHNPDTQALTNPQAKTMSTADVVSLVKKYLPYYQTTGGLTVSGGEPTLQAKDLIPIFQAVRKLGVTTCLDTNGSIISPDVEKLYLQTNLVIFDVKHIDPVWHKKLVGGDNATVLGNVQLREKQGLPFWLRLVLVPGYSDQPEYLQAWGETFANLQHLEHVEILPYHTYALEKYEQLGWPYPLPDVPAATDTDVAKARAILEPFFGKKLA
jgi:pyruvate formate lyase activating enzyme